MLISTRTILGTHGGQKFGTFRCKRESRYENKRTRHAFRFSTATTSAAKTIWQTGSVWQAAGNGSRADLKTGCGFGADWPRP